VGDEFYERLNSQLTGLHPPQWLRTLAEETGTALRASVADGTGDWRQLWALLCGLALMAPPGNTDSETVTLAHTYLSDLPDIKDPYVTALAEVDMTARLLADRGLASGIGYPADGWRPAGDPLVARDVYGSRFLLVAPFGYDGEAPEHWYAWDIDQCWLVTVTGAGAFGSAEDALAEWQHAVGPAAGTMLSPSTPETTARCWQAAWRPGRCQTCCREASPGSSFGSTTAFGGVPAVSPAPPTPRLPAAPRPRPAAMPQARCTRRSWVVRDTARCPAGRRRRGGDDPRRVGAEGTSWRVLLLLVLTAPDRDGGAPDP